MSKLIFTNHSANMEAIFTKEQAGMIPHMLDFFEDCVNYWNTTGPDVYQKNRDGLIGTKDSQHEAKVAKYELWILNRIRDDIKELFESAYISSDRLKWREHFKLITNGVSTDRIFMITTLAGTLIFSVRLSTYVVEKSKTNGRFEDYDELLTVCGNREIYVEITNGYFMPTTLAGIGNLFTAMRFGKDQNKCCGKYDGAEKWVQLSFDPIK